MNHCGLSNRQGPPQVAANASPPRDKDIAPHANNTTPAARKNGDLIESIAVAPTFVVGVRGRYGVGGGAAMSLMTHRPPIPVNNKL